MHRTESTKDIQSESEKGPSKHFKIDSKELQKKEIKLFLLVMIAFTIGMAFLLYYDISAWWIWYLYFAVWTLLELKIAKNINLKWWHWALIILTIIFFDWMVLEFIEYVKMEDG